MLPNNNNCTDKEKGNFLDFVSFDITRNRFSYFYKNTKLFGFCVKDAVLSTGYLKILSQSSKITTVWMQYMSWVP